MEFLERDFDNEGGHIAFIEGAFYCSCQVRCTRLQRWETVLRLGACISCTHEDKVCRNKEKEADPASHVCLEWFKPR